MVAVGITIALASLIFGVYLLTSRFPGQRGGWHGVWRLAGLIAALRISALWFGVIGLSWPDWLQSAAYLLLMLDLPEIYLVKGARSEPFRWAILGSLIVTCTSIVWSAIVCWVWNRLRLER